MKAIWRVFLAAVLLGLTACNAHPPADTGTSSGVPPAQSPITDTSEHKPVAPPSPEPILLPLPGEWAEFSFLSGAGAWQTVLTLNRDGTFTGCYHDSEMGEIGQGYPNGSAYTCNFSGSFTNIEPINEYSYKMTLADIKTEKPVGEEWIEDEIRYVASAPHGLNDPIGEQECTEFVFYLPDTPVDRVSGEFLSWWPYRYAQDTAPKATLSCYGILNVTTQSGFFTAE